MSDGKIEEIRERHEDDPPQPGAEDIAILLAEVDRQRAEIERLSAGILSLAKSLRASLDAAIRQRDEARAEIERLREALIWYADPRNHFPVERLSHGPAVIFVEEPPIMSDGGTRARSALEGNPQP